MNRLEKQLNDFTIVRHKIISVVDTIDESKLMVIPDRLSNNIYWQCGHLITVQASLLYKRTNSLLPIDDSYLIYFAKGSSPQNFDNNIPSFKKIRFEMESLIEYTASSLELHADLLYDEEIAVSTGHIIKSFTDALAFLSIHEAHHLGSISTLKKLV